MKIFTTLLLVGVVGLSILLYVNPDARKQLRSALKITSMTSSEKAPPPVSKEETQMLIVQNIDHFAQAVKAKDMSLFYKNISQFWQNKTSVAKLNQVFKPFIDSGIDLRGLRNMKPIIDTGPEVTNKADLHLTGHYDTTPSIVSFKQTYYMEGTGEWKLAEFFMDVKNP